MCERVVSASSNGHGSAKRRAWAVAAIFAVASAVLPGAGLLGRADAAEFEVGTGYLSASVRDIVESYGWSLVWAADEDRVVDYPFVIANGSLREALTDLLAIYGGQFVADLYEGNRVVLVDSAPPRVRVVLPGAAVGSDDVRAVAPARVSTAYPVGTAPVEGAGHALTVKADAAGAQEAARSAASSRGSTESLANAGTRDRGLANRHVAGE